MRRMRLSAMYRAWRGLAALALLASAASAQALCTVICSCNVSTTSVAFPPYNPLASGNDDGVGQATVSCGGVAGLLIPYSIALSAGGSGNAGARTMSYGGTRLAYNLYTTSALSTVWGDGTGGTGTVGGGILLDVAGLAPPVQYTIYGRVPGGQSGVAPGSYTDTITVTLTYY